MSPTGTNSLQDGWKHFDLAERAARFGYWRLSLADRTMFWSDGFYRLLGANATRQAPDLRWLLKQIEPRDVPNLLRRIDEAVARHAPFHLRIRARSQTAAAQVIDIDGETETSASGQVVAIAGVCTDVTAQVKAEAEREIAQERYRMMAEESSDIIVLYENGRAACASHALSRVLGLAPWQLEGGHYLDVVHPEDRAEAGKLRGRPNHGEIWTATYRARHANGHYVWIEAATRGISGANGVHREITVARDISERKEQELKLRAAQDRAEAANRAKSLFLANMSHELRTPLNAIIGFAEVMRQHVFGALGNSRYEEYATEIYNSGRFLLDQFCDILDMARIEGGMLELEPKRFDMTETARECVRQMRAAAEARGLVLEADIPSDGAWLVADRRAVKQILLNLLSNAVKFTRSGGRIVVEVRTGDASLELIVRDNGVGIPAGALDRLGRPFEQICADPHLAKSGQGLGLALVHALARKHAGTVTIESEEGSGTLVRVALPAEAARAAA
ncbi:MAG: PAS domain-containing sensor histidine kinase [Rhizomicrobium sp.]